MGLEQYSPSLQKKYKNAVRKLLKKQYFSDMSDAEILSKYKAAFVKSDRTKNEKETEKNISEQYESEYTTEQMLDRLIDQRETEYYKRYSAADKKVLNYIASREKEYEDEDVISFFIQDSKHRSLPTLLEKDRAYDMTDSKANTDAMLQLPSMKNLYAPKTDVTSLEVYNTELKISGLDIDFKKDYYQKYLNEIQDVQIDVPDSIDEKTATMIIIGEYLKPELAKRIYKNSETLFGQKTDDNGVTLEAWISSHYFNNPSARRPNEWSVIMLGDRARKNAKEIIDNIEKDPQRAAKSIERTIRTLMPFAYNMPKISDCLPHARLVSAAYESLQDPMLAKYSSLSKQEIENITALQGFVKATDEYKDSLYKCNDLMIKAQVFNKQGNIGSDPEYKKAYEDLAVNHYIQSYLANASGNSAAIRSSIKYKNYGPDEFVLAYAENPEAMKAEIRSIVLSKPGFAEELYNTPCTAGFKDDRMPAMDTPGCRMLSNNPKNFSSTLKSFDNKIKESIDSLGKAKLNKNAAYKPLADAVKAWDSYKKTTSSQKTFTAEDLTKGADILNNIAAASSSLYDASENGDSKDLANYASDKAKMFSGEVQAKAELGPSIKFVSKHAKYYDEIRENIEYHQFQIKLALDSAKKLSENLFKIADLPEDKMNKKQAEINKSIAKINKIISRSCANILVNRSLKMKMDLSGHEMNDEKWKKLTGDEIIKSNVSKVLKSPEFKDIMKNLDLDTIAASSSIPGKAKFPTEGIDGFAQKYIKAIGNPKNAVKQMDELSIMPS